MAQDTGAIAFVACQLEYSTGGSTTYTDISGFFSTLAIDGGERNHGEYYTADGDTAVIRGGKRTPVTLTANIMFTQTTTDPFGALRTVHHTAGGGVVTFRFSPNGGAAGDYQFLTDNDNVVLKNVPDPQGDVAPGDIIPCEVALVTSALTQSVVV